MVYGIRILAAVYVLYTAFGLLRKVIAGQADHAVGFTIAGIIFLLFGAGFIVTGIRGWQRESEKEKQEAEENLTEDTKSVEDTEE